LTEYKIILYAWIMENTSEVENKSVEANSSILKPIKASPQPEQQTPVQIASEQLTPTEPDETKRIGVLQRIINSLKGENKKDTQPTESTLPVQTPASEPVKTSPWVQRAEESGHAYNPDSKTLEEQWTGKK